MSAAAQTKIFGIRINVDPKILVGALAVVVVLVFWLNMRGSDDAPAGSNARPAITAVPAPVPALRKLRTMQRGVASAERGVLRIKPVDASDGRIDPTLRLDLMARLQTVEPMKPGRSLFEIGPGDSVAQAAIPATKVPVNAAPPAVVTPPVQPPPPAPVANIPLRFYGFVNPASKNELNRGLFMDGDNILVGKEGEVLEGRYLVVTLTASSARMEDIQARLGQTLPVTPEALTTQ